MGFADMEVKSRGPKAGPAFGTRAALFCLRLCKLMGLI